MTVSWVQESELSCCWSFHFLHRPHDSSSACLFYQWIVLCSGSTENRRIRSGECVKVVPGCDEAPLRSTERCSIFQLLVGVSVQPQWSYQLCYQQQQQQHQLCTAQRARHFSQELVETKPELKGPWILNLDLLGVNKPNNGMIRLVCVSVRLSATTTQ